MVFSYNKNVIMTHENQNKSVRKCLYGTTDFEKTAELEGFSLP